jgi:tetratricopeptide (TPR) repeat protein
MKKTCALLAFIVGCCVLPLSAQSAAAQVEARILNSGSPVAGAQVVLTNQTTARIYKAKTDGNGNFVLIGAATGNNYVVEVLSPTGESLFKRTGVQLAPQNGPISWTIDVSNPARTNIGGVAPAAQQPKYTKEQLEEIRKQNEKAQNMNALITRAVNAMNAKDFQSAVSPLQQLIQMEPNRYEFYQSLGDAQLNLGHYDEAAAAYEKGISLAQNTPFDAKNPATDPAKLKQRVATMLTNEGNAYLKLHKNREAVEAFTRAAALDPNPATAYFNLCATQFNAGDIDGALAACDKALQFDPNKADAWFIKGSLLLSESKTDAQGSMIAPPGTAEALRKYLELAPNGPHAADTIEMMNAIGAKIETTYKEKKKK